MMKLATSLLLLLALSSAAAAEDIRPISVPAGDLTIALETLARQSGIELIYHSDQLKGRSTKGVKGTLSGKEAAEKLIEGTDLVLRTDSTGAMLIVPRDTPPVKASADAAAQERGPMRLVRAEAPQVMEQSQRTQEVTDQRAPSNRTRTSTEVSDDKLQEIIVTATKRSERVQDVPMSIAVVTSEDIERRGLVDAEDYLRGIPGVNQGADAWGQSIVIRGIESSPNYQNWYTGTTTATYFGETPTTSSGGLSGGTNVDIKLVDIERVEVLRGPQGTAFGSAAMGGAVRTVPVAPKLDGFEGKVAAGYSSTSGFGSDNYNLQAVGNIPLVRDKLAIRATAYQFNESGYYRNRAESDPGFRARVVVPFGADAYARDQDDVGAYYVLGGRLAALYQPREDLRFTLSYLKQKTETDGTPVATSGTYEQTILALAPENVLRGQSGGFADTDVEIANAVMEYEFGWASLLATYSYLTGGSTNAQNYSSIYLWAMSERGTSEQRMHAGEVRLVTKFDGAWNFLAGLYAEDVDDTFSDVYYWTGDPATNIFIPGAQYVGAILDDRRKLRQKAAFGEVSWEFLPRFTLTGGIRAYDYDRTAQVVTEGLFGDGTTNVAGDASDTNFRANLSYKPSEEALVYTGWSQGFRLGKPQTGLPPSLCDMNGDGIVDGTGTVGRPGAVTIESTKRTDSDEVDSYELGGKFALLDRRLIIDATVFRMDWAGIPVSVGAPRPPEGCGLGYTANAGAARSEGIEFQSHILLTKVLRLDLGGSWIDARLTEDVPTAGFTAGSRLPGSPKVNANLGLQYEFVIGGNAAFVRADAIYIGSIYGGLAQQTPATLSGDYVKLDATARVRVREIDIDLFVRNLTDEDAFAFRSILDFGDFYGYRLRPRTVGVQLTYDF